MSQAHAPAVLEASFEDESATIVGCTFCVAGDPVAFHFGAPCCSRCLDTFREAGRAFDTIPCLPPDECGGEEIGS